MSGLTNTYRFSYESEYDDEGTQYGYPKQKSMEMTVSHFSDTEWTAIMLDFADFLSGIYGYDVKNKLRFIDHHGYMLSRAAEYSIENPDTQQELDLEKSDEDKEWS
jgi:uncharacterized protein YydD (DUF2326 family)